MFGKVDAKLGEGIRKVAENKIENQHAHPHIGLQAGRVTRVGFRRVLDRGSGRV